jgi:hypothetical protein
MKDLMLSEPNDYNFFFLLDGPSFLRLFTIVTLAVANRFTNMREAVTLRQHLSITLCYLDSGVILKT